MSLQEEVELLRRIPLFAKIEAAKLKLLAFTSERLTYQAGDLLFEQGAVGDSAYVIIAGSAEVLMDAPGGAITVATIDQHQIVGEIAILCDVPRTATVRAVSDLIALRVSKDHFFRLIEEFPQMAVEIMRELAHRLEATTSRLREAMLAAQNDG
ncbi:MAG: cyclic nucleotide-binding domain-containing protein [Alphaproteobacteria bacterium]